jgi:prepilin-type processing-associated H-X9-DG protein
MSEPAEQRPKRRCGCWCAAVLVLVMLGVACYYAVCAIVEFGNRAHCANEIQQIGLAMHCYHQAYGRLPPAYTTDSDGRPLLSWRVLLLPYLGCEDLYKKVRLNEPWDSPHNYCKVFDEAKGPTYQFHCCSATDPESETNPESETSYVMVVGPDTISDGPHSVNLGDITDGTANTIMVVEIKNSGIHWAEPRDLDFASMSFRINDPNGKGISSDHPGVAYVVFADGHVGCLADNLDSKLVKALLTINGGEDVSNFTRTPNPRNK